VTEAGTSFTGTVKSSIGLGILLHEGIGDTIRVSLAAEPQEEVRVAWEIVKSLGLRTRGVTVVACPTCGRLDVDNFVEIVTEIERRLAHVEEPLHLSIMGCAVNGPGEAHDSQLGITFGRGVGMIFKDGVPMRKVAGENIVDAFVAETEKTPGGRQGCRTRRRTHAVRPELVNKTNHQRNRFVLRAALMKAAFSFLIAGTINGQEPARVARLCSLLGEVLVNNSGDFCAVDCGVD
jgi:hypothetical protein